MLVSETLPDNRAGLITSAASKLLCALADCPDDKFNDRLSLVNKLVEVWSEGDDVDMRCNDPPRMVTAQLSAADVQRLANNQNAPGSILFTMLLNEFVIQTLNANFDLQ